MGPAGLTEEERAKLTAEEALLLRLAGEEDGGAALRRVRVSRQVGVYIY